MDRKQITPVKRFYIFVDSGFDQNHTRALLSQVCKAIKQELNQQLAEFIQCDDNGQFDAIVVKRIFEKIRNDDKILPSSAQYLKSYVIYLTPGKDKYLGIQREATNEFQGSPIIPFYAKEHYIQTNMEVDPQYHGLYNTTTDGEWKPQQNKQQYAIRVIKLFDPLDRAPLQSCFDCFNHPTQQSRLNQQGQSISSSEPALFPNAQTQYVIHDLLRGLFTSLK